jgi:hypothetical protein
MAKSDSKEDMKMDKKQDVALIKKRLNSTTCKSTKAAKVQL